MKAMLRTLWHFWPRPWYAPWRSLPYYRWRVETFTGIPADEITWRTYVSLGRQRTYWRAVGRWVRWLGHMQRRP